jgi:predicted exporter
MGNCPLNPKEEDEGYAEWLVIPFDRPVQVAACSIVGVALISIRATFVIPGRAKHEPGIQRLLK